MLDIVFVLTTLALFGLVALVAKGVERLGPRPGASVHPGGAGREEQGR